MVIPDSVEHSGVNSMARGLRWVIGLWCGLWLAVAYAEPRTDRCVILISVDGLANFYLDDPRAEMPTIRRLIREGVRAEGTVCSFPTVTWPNHTTLVTGVPPRKHGVIGNNYFDRTKAEAVPFIPDPLFDKEEIVKSPTIYDVAHQAGLKTAGVIWPATRNAKTLDWSVPDMAGDDAWVKYGTPGWMTELRAAGIPVEKHGTWVKDAGGGVQRDWLYTRLAAHVLREHSPHLLLVHLIELDHVQHKFGPKTPEAYWAVSYEDDRVRDIVEAAQKMAKKVTVIVASDHGFQPINKEIRPNVLLKQQGLWSGDKKLARCVSQGGGCMVYILDAARKTELLASLRDQFRTLDGVAEVLEPAEFGRVGQPTASDDPRAPDLWLAAKGEYSFVDADAGEDVVAPRATPGGTHGYLPDQAALYGTLVLWGDAIKAGSKLGRVSNQDVAPTMARLLNVALPTADGQVLEAGLTGK
jgi:predicted AlkP superfamily pyrophosphatase or phosphodiesterase